MITPYEHGILLLRNNLLHERNWRSDNCYKFIYSPKGKGRYATQRGDVSINKGQFYLLNPNEPHQQLEVTDEKFLIELDESLFRNVTQDLYTEKNPPEFAGINYYHPQIQRWASFVREAIQDATADEATYFLEHSVPQLVLLLMKHGPGSHQTKLSYHSSPSLSRAIEAIRDDYSANWSLAELAALCNLSKYQFAHVFKETYGIAPYSWLQLYRIIRSQDALYHSDDSILQIALDSGFTNLSSYNKLFKKLYGRTPSHFRLNRN
ncbi:helix-turn-helix domain-containing protein [Guptibacillus algicola]|uniref:helix-turn-helix domain-containing protein n=1 Tax=Guptibacillus algicola TaxID=225844 RepID=UPI001CD4F575|nr:AraC family transcriptional regulator [Alkalihalobacillus algicola]MCA0988713.1 AraC family transcriptional regulator [Alkalihalobacillus algicola]